MDTELPSLSALMTRKRDNVTQGKEEILKVKHEDLVVYANLATLCLNLTLRPLVSFSVCTSSIGVEFGGGL